MRGSQHLRAGVRGLRSAGRERAGRGRRRRQRADVGPRLRARGAGRRAARHHAGLPGRGAALRPRAQAVRPADRRVPADAGQARRHVHRPECLPRLCLCRRPRPATAAQTTRKDAAGAILYAAEKATWMALRGDPGLGGNGYINEYPTGRLLRDAKLYEIGAGTSEIRRMLIGRELFAENRADVHTIACRALNRSAATTSAPTRPRCAALVDDLRAKAGRRRAGRPERGRAPAASRARQAAAARPRRRAARSRHAVSRTVAARRLRHVWRRRAGGRHHHRHRPRRPAGNA